VCVCVCVCVCGCGGDGGKDTSLVLLGPSQAREKILLPEGDRYIR